MATPRFHAIMLPFQYEPQQMSEATPSNDDYDSPWVKIPPPTATPFTKVGGDSPLFEGGLGGISLLPQYSQQNRLESGL